MGCFVKKPNADWKESISLEVFQQVYCEQKFSWDCGLACCQMILAWLGKLPVTSIYEHPLGQLKTPLWTIDLVLLLHELGVEVSMRTKVLGAEQQHGELDWYANSFEEERIRVNEQFRAAVAIGCNVTQVSNLLLPYSSLTLHTATYWHACSPPTRRPIRSP